LKQSCLNEFRIKIPFSHTVSTDLLWNKTLWSLSRDGVYFDKEKSVCIIFQKEIDTNHSLAIQTLVYLLYDTICSLPLLLGQISDILRFKIKKFTACFYFCRRENDQISVAITKYALRKLSTGNELLDQYLFSGILRIKGFVERFL